MDKSNLSRWQEYHLFYHRDLTVRHRYHLSTLVMKRSATSLPATPNGKRGRAFDCSLRNGLATIRGSHTMPLKRPCTAACARSSVRRLMAMNGSKNFRTRTLTDHALSADHQHAVATREQSQTWEDVTLAKNTGSRHKAIALAMQTCYWVITQEIAYCKYKAMVEFLQQQSLDSALFLN